MAISSLSPKSQKIACSSPAKWAKKLKKLRDAELEQIVKEVLLEASRHEYTSWNLAHKAFLELQARDSKYESQAIQEQFLEKTANCIAFPRYSIEIAGIFEQSVNALSHPNSILHPYPKSKIVKKVLSLWKAADAP